jgi:D-alanyl-D-alanine carboxypeptidase (penicillin-binding protein 5/6)
LPSGNNIARLFARWDAGSQDAFVVRMNQAARDLGMTHTSYTEPSGLEPTNVSTSLDQLALAEVAMKDRVFAAIVATPSTTIPGVPGQVTNTNTLVGSNGVVGVKTGSTTPAGGNLVWAARARTPSGERLVIGVVLHQDAGAMPDQGLQMALATSKSLIMSVQHALAQLPPSTAVSR